MKIQYIISFFSQYTISFFSLLSSGINLKFVFIDH